MTTPLNKESALCTACGLCCTGALHDDALLDEAEVEAALAIGLPGRPNISPARFSLPCPKLHGATCSIYEARPRVCAAYACRLLEEVRNGRPLESALDVVTEAHRLAGQLRAKLQPQTTFPESRARSFDQGSDAATQLASLAFSHYLDRHFRNRNEGPILKLETTP